MTKRSRAETAPDECNEESVRQGERRNTPVKDTRFIYPITRMYLFRVNDAQVYPEHSRPSGCYPDGENEFKTSLDLPQAGSSSMPREEA